MTDEIFTPNRRTVIGGALAITALAATPALAVDEELSSKGYAIGDVGRAIRTRR